jgi:hypothetical protein
MWQVILDALLDTLKVFPFILVIYILIELLERATSITRSQRTLQGGLAPLLGAATGIIPQCGFSVIAVFLATSDEALIILLGSSATNPAAAQSILPLVLIKLGIAIISGYLINFLLSGEKLTSASDFEKEHEHDHAYSCGREHDGKSAVRVYFVDPLLHSLKIAAYLFIINLIFGFIINAVGNDAIAATFIGGPVFQPFITAAIGLIPNCASSVIITSTFVNGGILFGSMVSGLCTNAGLGLVVLLKNTKKLKRNVLIIITVYLISVLTGMATNGIMVLCGLI